MGKRPTPFLLDLSIPPVGVSVGVSGWASQSVCPQSEVCRKRDAVSVSRTNQERSPRFDSRLPLGRSLGSKLLVPPCFKQIVWPPCCTGRHDRRGYWPVDVWIVV